MLLVMMMKYERGYKNVMTHRFFWGKGAPKAPGEEDEAKLFVFNVM
jgi:hypothetical protein